MAKKILGIDIGHDTLKLVLYDGRSVVKTAFVPVPNQLMREGRVVSPESMAELIRDTIKANKMSCNNAALVLPNEVGYVRNIVMPVMTEDQLKMNLPYEFRDYITDELKDYIFDYAMISTPDEIMEAEKAAESSEAASETPSEGFSGEFSESAEAAPTMELMAVAVYASYVEEMTDMLRKAGLKLVKLVPAVSCYISLIRTLKKEYRPENDEYGILDLGYQSIRMHIFKGDKHQVTRVIETGLSSIDNVIADAYNVDVHLAHTYLETNYDDCQNKDFCLSAFDNIAVELMRAINFYHFSNPDSQLTDIWLCGGGAVITPLRKAMEASFEDFKMHPSSELTGLEDNDFNRLFVLGVGLVQC